jgi:hypothetical protein
MRIKPLRVILIVALIHLALQHARHEMLLAVVAPLVLARPAAAALSAGTPAPPLQRGWTAGALAVALTLTAARLMLPVPEIDTASAPSRALAAIPQKLRSEPVLNSYSFGGFLIFAHVRPFIDGRADMFGAHFLSFYQRLASGDAELLKATLKRYDIAWTLFAPEQGAVATLDRLPGWRRLYSDAHAVAHVRDVTGVNPSELRGD